MMIAAYAEVTTGYWPAIVIGAVLLLILIVATVTAVRRAQHRRRSALARCSALIAEALLVRERLSGQIDADTYQARMKDVASGSRS